MRFDKIALTKLLLDQNSIEHLTCLKTLAEISSGRARSHKSYKPITKAFLDGFEIQIGAVNPIFAKKSNSILTNLLNGETQDWIVKHILYHCRGGRTFLWLTLTYETASLTPRTMISLSRVLAAVKDHARLFWNYDATSV